MGVDKLRGNIYTALMKALRKLEDKRDALLEELGEVGPFMEGSVGRNGWHCRNPRCRCQRGELHRATILTWKEKQRTVSRHVPKALEAEVRQWTAEMRRVRSLIKQIAAVQREIFYRLRER